MTSTSLHVIVVDDESAQRQILEEIVRDAGHQVVTAASAEEALRELERGAWDVLLTDLRMPGMDGVGLLRAARGIDPELVVILMTAYATVTSAVGAMRDGAYDYLQKPFEKEELVQLLRRVAERMALMRENERLRREVDATTARPILGDSRSMRALVRNIDRFAAGPGHVLITGESGTGKELVARRIHEGSGRSGAFVALNCGAIPETLAESELFGHEKGAFTGAATSRSGVFEQANGGTLFLDEISSLPAALQPKLLRVLQDGVVERVGGGPSRQLDVRIVAATNRDLTEMVASGAFREDLYHRLNVLELRVPPLRDRAEDVPILAETFRTRAAARYQVPPPPIDAELMDFLRSYRFPGNVRELEHLIEKMVVLSDGEPLGLDDLPPSIASSVPAPGHAAPAAGAENGARPEDLMREGSTSLVEVEERLLREAVRLSGGNLSDAARRLGISYKTMLYRARKFGL